MRGRYTSPVYTIAVFGTARLNLGTRTYKFWHGTLNFSRVSGRKTGPRAVYTTKIKRAVPKFIGPRAVPKTVVV